MRLGLLGVIVNITAVLTAAVLVWSPEVSTYWVGTKEPDETTVDRALREPSDTVLTEIARQRLGLAVVPKSNPAREKAEILRAAERLLSGEVQFPKLPSMRIRVPFDASNLDSGPPTYQLYVAGLGTVDLLLRAHRISADERFLRAARDEVAAFDDVDRRALVPRGFLWNDHALANRLAILADFWQLVRRRDDFDRASAAQLLALAARTAERLAKPALFTYRTNHGVMQSAALLQYAAAFPSIDGAVQLRSLGCTRLKDQMQVYVSPEGPVLEHSAGYHELGRYMLETSIRLFELVNCEVPPDWRGKLDGARAFSALLRRPDGTLPPLGNTDHEESAGTHGEWSPEAPGQPFALYPVSGFAVWWSGLTSWPRADKLSQTLVTWSNFPSRAHKRADDMSLIVWAGGYSWLVNSGYWPYGAAGFDAAQGWRGSNAPHFVSEATAGAQPARLRGAVDAHRVRAVDLERRVPHRGVLRRQIIDIEGSTWLIADSFDGDATQRVDRLWTIPPEAQLVALAENRFLLRVSGAQKAARLSIVGQLAGPLSHLRGKLDPFGGWVVRHGTPTQTSALSVLQSTPGVPVISVLEVANETEPAAASFPVLAAGSSADRWQVSLTSPRGPTRVTWEDKGLTVEFADGSKSIAPLSRPEDPSRAREAIVAAYGRLAQTYPGFRDLTYYRYRVTYLAAGLLVLQEVVMLGAKRWFVQAMPALRLLSAACWLAFGLLAALWYLK